MIVAAARHSLLLNDLHVVESAVCDARASVADGHAESFELLGLLRIGLQQLGLFLLALLVQVVVGQLHGRHLLLHIAFFLLLVLGQLDALELFGPLLLEHHSLDLLEVGIDLLRSQALLQNVPKPIKIDIYVYLLSNSHRNID